MSVVSRYSGCGFRRPGPAPGHVQLPLPRRGPGGPPQRHLPVSPARALLVGALLASGIWVSPAAATPPIQYDRLSHPRLFIKPSDVAAIREWTTRAGTDNKRVFDLWKPWMDARLFVPGAVGTGYKTDLYLADIASMYVLTGTAAYGDSAVKIAMWAARNGKQSWDTNAGPAGCSTLALAYDWCYERFTAAQRDTVAGLLAKAALDHPCSGGQWYWFHDYRFEFSFAILDDAPSYTNFQTGTVYTNTTIRTTFEKWVSDLYNGYVPCLNQVAPMSYNEAYPGRRQMPLVIFVASLLGIVDWDLMNEPTIANIGAAYLARYRPDAEWIRTPDKYNYADLSAKLLFSFYGSRGNDHKCQALINSIDDNFTVTTSIVQYWTYLFYHDPSASATDLSSLSSSDLVYYDSGQGAFLGRTGWTLGTSSHDIMVGFWCGGMFGNSDYNWSHHLGHFVASRGSDCLLIDSGLYMNDIDNQYLPYGKSTLAHNTISIFRPSMDSGEYDDCHNHTPNLDMPNSGGQIPAVRNYDRCPACAPGGGTPPMFAGWVTNPEEVELGASVIRLEADLSPAYRDRTSKVLRRWMWVRPDWIVIQDLIETQPGNGDTIRVVLHCVDRPQIVGTREPVIERGNILSGGVFRYSTPMRVVVNNGDSSARIFFRAPLGVRSPTLRLIGGTNAGGSPNAGWQQDHDPQFDEAEPSGHYDTYTPGGTSYEFWIDGKNYPPADTDCRTADEDYEERQSPDVGHKANPAGDWRLEYQAVAESSRVVLTTLVHVTQRDAPEEDPYCDWYRKDPPTMLIRLQRDGGVPPWECPLLLPGETGPRQWPGGP